MGTEPLSQLQPAFAHSSSTHGYISSGQWRLMQYIPDCLGFPASTLACHPSCQPEATKYGCSVHELCRCMWQPCVSALKYFPFQGIINDFKKYFLHFHNEHVLRIEKLRGKKNHPWENNPFFSSEQPNMKAIFSKKPSLSYSTRSNLCSCLFLRPWTVS